MKSLKFLILSMVYVFLFNSLQSMEEDASQKGDESLNAWSDDDFYTGYGDEKCLNGPDQVSSREIKKRKRVKESYEDQEKSGIDADKSYRKEEKRARQCGKKSKLEKFVLKTSSLHLFEKLKLLNLASRLKDEEKLGLLDLFITEAAYLEHKIDFEKNEHNFLLALPPEIVAHILRYTIMLPTKVTEQNIYESIKQICMTFFGIVLTCKALSNHKCEIYRELNKSLTNLLKKFVKQSVVFDNMKTFKLKKDSNAIVRLLLKTGADYNVEFEIEQERDNLLEEDEYSCAMREKRSVKDLVFLERLWDLDTARTLMRLMSRYDLEEKDWDGDTLFMRVLKKKYNADRCEIMLQHSPIDLNLKNGQGDTALILCVKYGSLQCLNGEELSYFSIIPKILMTNIDANSVDNKGDAALHSLIKLCRCKIDLPQGIQALFSGIIGKVDPNLQDNEGNTALMLLMMPGKCPKYRSVFVFLLAQGARLDISNKKGKDAWDISQGARRKFVVECMELAAKNEYIFCEINQEFVKLTM